MADLDEETLERLDKSKSIQAEKSQIKDINLTTWYHEGGDDLIQARKFIAEYSLPRSRERLCHARQYRDLAEAHKLSRLQKVRLSNTWLLNGMLGCTKTQTKSPSTCGPAQD